MHGEYKVPGGKLVAADVETGGVDGDGQVLTDVRISGDFFLEPDEALDAIDRALTGIAADTPVARMATLVEAAVGPDAVLVGLTPEAVAIAVRRALGRATSWHDHTFDVIRSGPEEPFMHMALDDVLAQAVGEGTRGPTLRLWEWERTTVVIGSFQSMRNEIDPDGAARHGVTVTRRVSGGGAMFIEPGNTITYSLYVPASLVEGLSFEQSYAFLDDWVLGALRELGIEATYVPLNDIASPAGKIGGAAQKRYASGAVLHHVTMSYDIDAAKMLEVLRIGREKLSDKGTTSAAKRVDPLRSQTGMPREAIIDAFVGHFAGRYATRPGEITAEERARAERAVVERFATPEWLHRVP
ncbi:biotin/lipoate A/B protein ligase [Beutenbergia cavernae DSM 12333]|uniref:Biotin/lipoate A/B protein ligase n=1 Tax=Beutenbergia cavernae (strain ATCC BAA-8 / DSM 12333 / CCUG 43141 / JCM 11478 / NBRC 16432 / NCIMB 13614 / HKI 0122) TaxID=471853 RepID=C5C2K0_BEUC1|nr:biotin/lipoate A/B protein ligase family protein [Beutenbergia cavernae]ACQ79686.1 biotin/lipoate A/B protein ligase [Beutenbergia cavernae DSM 12333]